MKHLRMTMVIASTLLSACTAPGEACVDWNESTCPPASLVEVWLTAPSSSTIVDVTSEGRFEPASSSSPARCCYGVVRRREFVAQVDCRAPRRG